MGLGTPKSTVRAFAAALEQLMVGGTYRRILERFEGGAGYSALKPR